MEKSLWLAGFNYFAEGGIRECVTAPGMSTQKAEGGSYWYQIQVSINLFLGKKFTREQPWMMLLMCPVIATLQGSTAFQIEAN